MKILLAVIMAIVVPGGFIILALAFLSKKLILTGRIPRGKLQKFIDAASRAWPARSQVVAA